MFVKVFELARGVYQQALELPVRMLGRLRDLRAVGEGDVASLQFFSDFTAPLKMAGDQDQEKIRKPLAQAQELIGQKGLLAGMRAARDQDGRTLGHSELPEYFA